MIDNVKIRIQTTQH